MFPTWAKVWVREKGGEFFFQLLDKGGRGLGGIFGDESPDIRKVIFRLVGYAEGARLVNRFFPFSMMRLELNFFTRPPFTSARPS